MTTLSVEATRDRVGRVTGGAWGRRLVAAGWVAKGVLYGLIALLALRVAAGDQGEKADQQGAVHTVAAQPFGKVLLVTLGLGLALYSLSRLLEALGVGHGDDASGLERAGYAISAVIYASFAVLAFKVLSGANGDQGDQATDVTAGAMEWGAGRWLVGLAGLGIAAVGLRFVWEGVSRSFEDHLALGAASPTTRTVVRVLGTVGLAARGVVFALAGWFVIQAAVQYDPQEAAGLDETLHRLVAESWGPLLLTAVALGLLAYGAYCFAEARWRETA